jgi:A/G-specific adenine glycosylase
MGKQGWGAEKIARVRGQLLEWYERSRRDLPWRGTCDSYAIWVSEIMLQQTRVAVVVERYQAFMARFPTLDSLAEAPEQEVLALWSGLGYYRRARMLHQSAQFVVEHYGGDLPKTAETLRALPGIGVYTAAAIASIAHDERVAVVDGNVERVLCRLEGWKVDGRAGGAQLRHKIEKLAAELVCPERPGDSNQALMELGAILCSPRNPQCLVCPVSGDCKTQGEHQTTQRPPMISREVAHALAVRTMRRVGREYREVLLEQRSASLTVMPGLWELPMVRETAVSRRELLLTVRHAIMRVNYRVRIRRVSEDDIDAIAAPAGKRRWVPLGEAEGMALTGLARKVLGRLNLLAHESADSPPIS